MKQPEDSATMELYGVGGIAGLDMSVRNLDLTIASNQASELSKQVPKIPPLGEALLACSCAIDCKVFTEEERSFLHAEIDRLEHLVEHFRKIIGLL